MDGLLGEAGGDELRLAVTNVGSLKHRVALLTACWSCMQLVEPSEASRGGTKQDAAPASSKQRSSLSVIRRGWRTAALVEALRHARLAEPD